MRLFSLCSNMKWSHLPLPGGIYAQHPQLLVEFGIIFDEKNTYEAQQMAEQKAKADRAGSRKGR